MRGHRCLASMGLLAAVIAAVWLAPVSVAGQQASTAAAKTYSTPRTAWGDPDLQGIWTNFDPTPFEQPNADKTVAAGEAATVAMRYRSDAPDTGRSQTGGQTGGEGGAWSSALAPGSPTSSKRPSMVVDPPNGRVPILPPASQFFRNYLLQDDSWEGHTPFERCVTRGVPGFSLQYGQNNAHQILQSPGYVAISSEMMYETRIIPVDGRPHVSQNIRLWNGDSRGRWEGQTLVVDTTNYNNKGMLPSSYRVYSLPQTEALHVVERFTRVDAKTINYQYTVEDPKVFTRPWTVAMPFNLDPAYQKYEYACHEGNRNYMELSLEGGRGRDKAAAEVAKKKTNNQ